MRLRCHPSHLACGYLYITVIRTNIYSLSVNKGYKRHYLLKMEHVKQMKFENNWSPAYHIIPTNKHETNQGSLFRIKPTLSIMFYIHSSSDWSPDYQRISIIFDAGLDSSYETSILVWASPYWFPALHKTGLQNSLVRVVVLCSSSA